MNIKTQIQKCDLIKIIAINYIDIFNSIPEETINFLNILITADITMILITANSLSLDDLFLLQNDSTIIIQILRFFFMNKK